MDIFEPPAITSSQQSLLEGHLRGVLEANKVHNLTRIDTWEDGLLLHVEDSLVGLPEIQDAPAGRYADLGTGGGFPGVPVAIMTGRETLLVDSVQKKMAAVQEIVDSLGLSASASTYGGRIEDLAKEMPQAFAVISARALSALPSLLELAVPLLQEGGRLVCYKSQLPDNELEHARALEDKLAMRLVSERHVLLSDGATERCIVVFERCGEPRVNLPRRVGSAQKNPYRA